MKTVVIDYGRGNIFSLAAAMSKVGWEHVVSDQRSMVEAADCIVLPGVGAFGDAVSAIRDRNLFDMIVQRVQSGVPYFGICIGMQLLGTVGEEFGTHQGFGLVPGVVRRLPEGDERIPNIGWRRVTCHAPGNWPASREFYFVHSFALFPEDMRHAACTFPFNGEEVSAVVNVDHILGCQFHPERSGPAGLEFLSFAHTRCMKARAQI